MPSFKLTATLLFVGALALFQTGCLGPGKSPPTRFYVLSTLAEMETDPSTVADLSDVAIGVGPVRIPGKLDRPQIIVRSSRNEVRLMELAEWGDPLAAGFARALAENLALLLKTEKVSIFPWLKATRRDYQVTVDVIDFILNKRMITADSFHAERIYPAFSDSACFSCVWLGIYRHSGAARRCGHIRCGGTGADDDQPPASFPITADDKKAYPCLKTRCSS